MYHEKLWVRFSVMDKLVYLQGFPFPRSTYLEFSIDIPQAKVGHFAAFNEFGDFRLFIDELQIIFASNQGNKS